jgi:hypothetical protein
MLWTAARSHTSPADECLEAGQLQRPPRREEVAHVGDRHARDLEPAMQRVHEQPFPLQLRERHAHELPADAQADHQLALRDRRPGRHQTAQHLVAQQLSDVVRGRGPLERDEPQSPLQKLESCCSDTPSAPGVRTRTAASGAGPTDRV